MQKKIRRLLSAALIILCGSSLSASAQFDDQGRVGTWTTGRVARRHEQTENPHLKVVRVAKQKGFDRVVFEFTGPMPNYSIRYLKGGFYEDEGGSHRIRIAGKSFLQITLNQIPMDEIQAAFSTGMNFAPEGRLKLPALQEVQEQTLFEGFYDFLLGVKSRRAFRVTEFQNPARVAIDFKH